MDFAMPSESLRCASAANSTSGGVRVPEGVGSCVIVRDPALTHPEAAAMTSTRAARAHALSVRADVRGPIMTACNLFPGRLFFPDVDCNKSGCSLSEVL